MNKEKRTLMAISQNKLRTFANSDIKRRHLSVKHKGVPF